MTTTTLRESSSLGIAVVNGIVHGHRAPRDDSTVFRDFWRDSSKQAHRTIGNAVDLALIFGLQNGDF